MMRQKPPPMPQPSAFQLAAKTTPDSAARRTEPLTAAMSLARCPALKPCVSQCCAEVSGS